MDTVKTETHDEQGTFFFREETATTVHWASAKRAPDVSDKEAIDHLTKNAYVRISTKGTMPLYMKASVLLGTSLRTELESEINALLGIN